METRLEQRVTELQTEVNQIVAEIQRLRHNPPADVAAPQQKVDAAIAELRAVKSEPTKSSSSRTSDAYKRMRQHLALEQNVRDAKRDRAIVDVCRFFNAEFEKTTLARRRT